MPIYEYQCQKCGAATEIMQKFSDAPLKKCSVCGGRVTKLMSANSFQLKGSGWYVTDYAGKKEAATPKTGAVEPAKEAPTKAKEAPAGPARAKKETPAQA